MKCDSESGKGAFDLPSTKPRKPKEWHQKSKTALSLTTTMVGVVLCKPRDLGKLPLPKTTQGNSSKVMKGEGVSLNFNM